MPRTAATQRSRRPRRVTQSPQPEWIDPMLATLTDRHDVLREGQHWLVERKLDGFRALAYRQGESVRLMTRNRKSLNDKFPEIVEALRDQPLRDFIIDGEIVGLENGRMTFHALQQRLKPITLAAARRSSITIKYHVFDLLFANGLDARSLPLKERKQLLKKAIAPDELVRINP